MGAILLPGNAEPPLGTHRPTNLAELGLGVPRNQTMTQSEPDTQNYPLPIKARFLFLW